jgi:hypothetical protein
MKTHSSFLSKDVKTITTSRDKGHVLDFRTIADRLMVKQMTVRILNGGVNMPAFGSILKSEGMTFLVAFLESLNANSNTPPARETARK